MGKAFSRPLLPYRPGFIEVDDGHGGRTYRSLSPSFSTSGSSPPENQEEPTMNEAEELNAIINILLGDGTNAGNGSNEESKGNEE